MDDKVLPIDHWKLEIVRFLKGELTFPEEQLLHQWVNESNDHALIFEEMRNTWLTSVTFVSEEAPLQEEWTQLSNRLFSEPGVQKSSSAFSIVKRVASIAAILIIGVFIGIVLSRFNTSAENKNNEVCEIITPLGAKSNIILPDGTQVWLNAGSKLSYKKSFNNKDRLVTLQGEAFFHVKTNKSKPFIVQTSRLSVKALGTTFNVKAYKDDKKVTATLVEGIIQVNGSTVNSKTFNVTLKPSQSITVDESKVYSHDLNMSKTQAKKEKNMPQLNTLASEGVQINSNVSTEKFTSWKDNQWLIEAENLENLAVLLGRKYNVEIHIETDSLKQYRFTGTIRNETLEQVLEILKLTTPLKYQIGKGEVWWNLDTGLQKDFSRLLIKAK